MLFKIHEKDNVAVALEAIQKGTDVLCGKETIKVLDEIPKGHKVALKDFVKGEEVIKYGNVIGIAGQNVPKGSWLHDHNILSQADEHRQYSYNPIDNAVFPGVGKDSFLGYLRKNGEVGTRNYIILISGSFCTNTHMMDFAKIAAERFPKTEHFDGFLPLTHECGCGQMGHDVENVRRVLGSLIQNPNFGGVMFVELGCENIYFDTVKPYIASLDEERFELINLQDTEDEYRSALSKLESLYAKVNQDRRVPCPVSKLHIAENCGGSDAFSGIAGNRLVGALSDHLAKEGATFSMTEVPEMFGAEHILMNRAKDEDTFRKIVDLIEGFKAYIEKYGASASGNPSYGNRKGGISTVEDKSLGCIQKGGNCAVMDVVAYGDRTNEHGLNLVWGPGSDLVGVTAQIAAGANIVLFITGRGTPVAYAAPTLKVATNTALFNKKREWMDFNAGLLTEGVPITELEKQLYDLLIATAEGRYQASNERAGFYQIALLRDGVTL